MELTRDRPPDAERYLDLPTEPEARIEDIAQLARDQTDSRGTDFEKGLRLEAWFHTFDYTTDIKPGQGATDLAAWLLDDIPDTNYRRGYCENFATAMAVMARTLDIPSRVVLGFGVPPVSRTPRQWAMIRLEGSPIGRGTSIETSETQVLGGVQT